MRVCLIWGLSVVATACGGDGTNGGEPLAGSGGTPGTSAGSAGASPDVKGGANVGGQSPAGGNGASTGGRSTVGGSNGGTSTTNGGTIPTGPKGQCPAWPNERLFPLVGVFFYGNDPKPCTRTITPAPNVSSSIAGTYDIEYDGAGYVVKMTNRDGATSYTFTREQDVIVSEVEAKTTSQSNLTYSYGPASAKYEVRYDSTLLSSVDYSRDTQGYPLSVSVTYYSASSPPSTRYVYEYDGCRIKQRAAYVNGDILDDTQTQTYEYDTEGRIITIRSPHMTEAFDYSCS